MIKKMLVAVDGSQHSMKCVEYAAVIAKATNAHVLLYHVIKPYNLPDALKQFAEAEHMATMDADLLKLGAKHLMSSAMDKAKSFGLSQIDVEADEGPIARTIVKRAMSFDADMIVVGSRGMGDIEATLRGGVSHRVEILAKCPVLVVK